MNFSSIVFCLVRGPLLAAFVMLSATGGQLSAASSKDPSDAQVEIDVRSYVDERWEGVRKRGPIEHGKVYLIASVNESPSAQKLLQPVDNEGLLRQFRQTLTSHGFREALEGDTPDVVLTVLYGRGFVRNPYLANIDGDIDAPSIVPTPAESLRAAAIKPSLYQDRLWGRYEQKVIKAQKEKLFIRVTAWKFPDHAQEKPVELWKTTMVVDEPDQNDLNQLYPQMLAAGASFFDRPMKTEEVTVSKPLKEGNVEVGPVKVIE
ncbi:MAG TPA: hypothetical protein PLN52_17310 [Opitutaceae bacterium]|nr:hypothetical protein [Opitutaceae bacterium]